MNLRIMFAVNDLNKENELRSQGLKEFLGCYKGQTEVSFMDVIDSKNGLEKILDLAKKYNQESILKIDENNKASLIIVDTKDCIPLGQWTEVSSIEGLENYSVSQNGKIYSCID